MLKVFKLVHSFFTKFYQCFYTMSKELFNNEKPTTFGLLEYGYILIFLLVTFRMLFIAYVMYLNYELPLFLVNLGYDFKQHDMVINFFFTYSAFFDYTMLVIVYAFAVFIFLIEYWCFRLDVVNVGRGNWRFWWQLTVVNLDQYKQCRLEGSELKRVNDLKRMQYEDLIDQSLSRFSLGYFTVLPVKVKRPIAWALARVSVVYRMEDINVVRLQLNHLPAMPALSWKVRKQTLRYMLATEMLATVFQAFIGKFLIPYTIIQRVLENRP